MHPTLVTRAAVSKLTGAATLVVVAAAVVLRVIASPSWRAALGAALVVLGIRILVMAWGAAHRELSWSRLLLPTIILLEGAGMWSADAAALWQVRLATVAALEIAFVLVAIRELRRTTEVAGPVEARIAMAFGALLPPRFARLAAFELVILGSAIRFAIGGWRHQVPPGFTYHRESGLRSFLPLLPLLAIGDILLLELVILPHAATWLRLLVHGLALYGVLWMLGLYASLRARPHQLVDGRLTLHRGMLRRLTVPVGLIASIETLPDFPDDWAKRAYCKGAIRLDVAGPTILELRLHEAVRPIGVLGEGAASTRVLVALDDPTSFIAAIQRAGQAQSVPRSMRSSSALLDTPSFS